MPSPEETDPLSLAARSGLRGSAEPRHLVSVTSSAKHSSRIFMMATSEPVVTAQAPLAPLTPKTVTPDAGLFRISAVGSNNELAKTGLAFATAARA